MFKTACNKFMKKAGLLFLNLKKIRFTLIAITRQLYLCKGKVLDHSKVPCDSNENKSKTIP
jgi:hypothetical protein